jgi:hypothetical protein
MQSVSHAAMSAAIGTWDDDDRRPGLGSIVQLRLRRRFLTPLLRSDPLLRHNATRGVRLFVAAAFAGLDPARIPAGPAPQLVCALFGLGAIESAVQLTGLSPFERRRIEIAFLRRVYGVGCLRVRRMRRDLARRGDTPRGRVVLRAGRLALLDWFRGVNPSPRLQELIARLPAERLLRRSRGTRAPVRVRAHAVGLARTKP